MCHDVSASGTSTGCPNLGLIGFPLQEASDAAREGAIEVVKGAAVAGFTMILWPFQERNMMNDFTIFFCIFR